MPEPVIELVPKRPPRWGAILAFAAVGALVMAAAFYLKAGALRLLFPILLIASIAYLIYCAIHIMSRRK